MMKVNFMIIGAMKAGTTTFFEILKSHPDIVCSKIKETHFFSTTSNWKKELPRYHKLFKQGEGKIYGEASPTYAFLPKYPGTSKRIYDYNPDMKIIYLIRNPIDRCISHYMHMVERGYTNLPIEEALEKIPQIIETSRYYCQIKPYLDLFEKEQIMIINFDKFIREKHKVVQEISSFLNVEYSKFPSFENIHTNSSINSYKLHPRYDRIFKFVESFVKRWPEAIRIRSKKMLSNPKRVFKEKPVFPNSLRKNIHDLIKPEIIELEKLFTKDLSEWLKN